MSEMAGFRVLMADDDNDDVLLLREAFDASGRSLL